MIRRLSSCFEGFPQDNTGRGEYEIKKRYDGVNFEVFTLVALAK
jgi:hypothetical protein